MIRQTQKNIVVFFVCFTVVVSWFAGYSAQAQDLKGNSSIPLRPAAGGGSKAFKESDLVLPPSSGVSVNSPGMQLSVDDIASSIVVRRTPEEIKKEIRRAAFGGAVTGLLPLKPHEIRTLLEAYDKTREAVEKPVYPYPEPEIVVETVSLDPGSVPPVIKVAIGHVSTLSTIDITGEPWPIQDIAWAGNFEVIQPEEGGNILRITPMAEFAHGNMSIRLLELKTPVTFTLETQRDVVQYRFDARIPEFGPFAKLPLIDGGITIVAGNMAINSILDGTPPPEAIKLQVAGVDRRTTAYRLGVMTYVRTPLTLLSPGWSNSVSSADGMNVYALENAPVLLLSNQGTMVRAHLKEEEILDE